MKHCLVIGLLALTAWGAQAQSMLGSLGDPLQRSRPVIEAFFGVSPNAVRVRYVVLEGSLRGLDALGLGRDRLIQMHRLCVASKPGAISLPDSAFPQHLSAMRTEGYLSQDAQLDVKTHAIAMMSQEDCSLHWKITRRGYLGVRGTRSTCVIDYEAQTYGGGCQDTGTVFLEEKPDGRREGTAPPPSKVVAGQTCYVIASPMANNPDTMGGAPCIWIIETAQRAQFPGLLSRTLPLELDYGPNGVVPAVRAEASRQVDARLFVIPAGLQRRSARP